MKIEHENTLKQALNAGINIFAGAGFSVLASDVKSKTLPIGSKLASELQTFFHLPKLDLVKLATILESTKRDEFYTYLKDRFSVKTVPDVYFNINSINVKGIYTTNIDNLFPEIINKSKTRFLHDQQKYGLSLDKNAINYLPLHGSVDNYPYKFIFSSTALATIYNDATRIWNYLSVAIETHPTIFIGYSLSDSSTIESLFSKNTFQNAQKDKWIVLLPNQEDEEIYFKALGFNTIISDTNELLSWFASATELPNTNGKKTKTISEIFPKNIVPKNKYKLDVIRPIENFFRGEPPIWNDVLSNLIYKTSYYKLLQDSVYNPSKNTILIGAPATGKTTLMMQVAYEIIFDGDKMIFDNITEPKVDYITKIAEDKKVLIFIENFTDDVNAFIKLCSNTNFTVVGIDRSHYYGIVSHLFDENKFNVINVTNPSELDIQGIFSSLPTELRTGVMKIEKNSNYHSDTIFEFVNRNIANSNITQRYKDVISHLEAENPDLAEFLVLCAYTHSSRIPLSSEMAISYYSDEYNYQQVFDMRQQITDIIKDYDHMGQLDDSFDYYYPKSYYIAESIINQSPKSLLKRVMQNMIIMIPPIQICNYNVFRKHAFDKNLVLKAFTDWKEGKAFYEDAFLYDYNNPFILQQGALYLSAKKQFSDAFTWIDKALNMTSDKYFSIRNSHAIILFDANVSNKNDESRKQLDKSMEILQRCIKDDKRTTFHAIQYASQAVRYNQLYNDDISAKYLNDAKKWLTVEYNNRKWDRDVFHLLKTVNDIVDKI